ncbi:hypothetical protein MMC26_005159 [Xylographa opegraphella]|nr:hypothetical protein [Xylographa opegraphella]
MATAEGTLASLDGSGQPISTGPYTLRSLMENVPLSAEGQDTQTTITCVEYWDGNLYIGTSAAEILHFVSFPNDASDEAHSLNYILASRLELSQGVSIPGSSAAKGVQQILLLPSVNKACVRCNNVLTFYSLPELSPAFGNTKVSGCSWIGGRDLDVNDNQQAGPEVIMICIKNRIRLVRIGEEPRLVKNIEYPGCLASARRGRFACVADAHSYALLDVDNQQKIPLFPISSLEEQTEVFTGAAPPDIVKSVPQVPGNLTLTKAPGDTGTDVPFVHERSTSVGALVGGLGNARPASRSRNRDQTGIAFPGSARGQHSPQQSASPIRANSISQSPTRVSQGNVFSSRSIADSSQDYGVAQWKTSQQPPVLLKPNINSPIASEFLLTTGTSLTEPGVGIFVNCDGDVVRGTLEFSQYPSTIVIDGRDPLKTDTAESLEDDQEGFVLATMKRTSHGLERNGLEVQRWDVASEGKTWLAVPEVSHVVEEDINPTSTDSAVGLAMTLTVQEIHFEDVGNRLRSKRLRISGDTGNEEAKKVKNRELDSGTQVSLEDWEIARSQQEDDFARRLGRKRTRIVTWSGSSIFWVVRNPLALRLECVIDEVLRASQESRLDQNRLVKVMREIHNQEARTETDFLSLEYIRQKISIILFADIATNRLDVNQYVNEHLFVEGGLDPRVLLSMVPLLREDIVEGPKGIWIHAGLVALMESQLSVSSITLEPDEILSRPEEFDLLGLTRRYLSIWRQRKGFGSIADEAQVFSTVDAALLHVLLYQDHQSLGGPGGSSTVRVELYAIVDNGVDCFDRAVELLERFCRLYVLSRLYQKRKMAGKVLATWRRIIDGEHDDGGELIDGENEVRKYLVKIRDLSLVEEYGTWLARRNPALGVQVFTDDQSRVKLSPHQVVQLLRSRAPDAVKEYLEHLVFGKKNVQYANDLISYYLDNVLAVLNTSDSARSILAQSYISYRALHPPKPTYRQFIIDNAIPASWWHDRLRLLELLGGSHGAGFSYNIPEIMQRIEPFEDALVPETIILDGRQGRHHQALRLLTHGLGDYHTAINYCLLGGSSIFHPTSGRVDSLSIPCREEQATLFKSLLSEFLRIEDTDDRVERTCELLERFGTWFDVAYVLELIPDSWSVELVSAFLISSFRQLVQDKVEAMITKALSGAENLKISADLIEKCQILGPQIEVVESQVSTS